GFPEGARHQSDWFLGMQANRGNPSVVVRRGTPNRAATARERCLRYFITFACYGARLHGDESGSVDRQHNLAGSRLLEPDAERVMAERRDMLQDPYVLAEGARPVVLAAHPEALRTPG